MLYVVSATIVKRSGLSSLTRQIPTFYLDSSVQGIMSTEQAKKIAHEIINPMNDPSIEVHATPYEV